jgi:hypothetical protein
MNYAEVSTPGLLKENILKNLLRIASDNDILIDEALYDQYLVVLVQNSLRLNQTG